MYQSQLGIFEGGLASRPIHYKWHADITLPIYPAAGINAEDNAFSPLHISLLLGFDSRKEV